MRAQYWLMKSEPTSFSIDDLEKRPNQTTCWDGVRNYQARNYMRAMRTGDQVLFYHSNADPPGIAGVAEIVRKAYPDHTAFDPDNKHYDPKSNPAKPTWDMVDVRFVRKLKNFLPLERLREVKALQGMELLRKASRLSVQPVTPAQWKVILKLADK
ncbi:MAG TPA: EVE domain-containing protein [Blastocatellia bacterium]|nr:EVE domain-containing protein [Blastocatellia bacterium]